MRKEINKTLAERFRECVLSTTPLKNNNGEIKPNYSEFARLVNEKTGFIITGSAIRQYAVGERSITYDKAELFGKLLNVDPMYFMDEKVKFKNPRDYYKQSVEYHNHLDSAFSSFLEALEISCFVEFKDEIIKSTNEKLNTQYEVIEAEEPTFKQNIVYSIKTPQGVKELTETEFAKFKDQICKYVIFLTEEIL